MPPVPRDAGAGHVFSTVAKRAAANPGEGFVFDVDGNGISTHWDVRTGARGAKVA